jgi:tripartite-type tricarboxylate transporter receptor subunit TctC
MDSTDQKNQPVQYRETTLKSPSHRIARIASLALLLFATAACAQEYPVKPVTMIIPFAAGGPTDVVGRALAKAMSRASRGQFNVENTAGAGGTYGATRAAKSAPDGYTLLLHHMGQATAPALYPKLGYDPVADFEPIGLLVNVPMTLVARPNLGPSNFKELLAYMRDKKNQVKIGNGGVGSASHLCGLLLMSRLELSAQTMPYKGTGPALKGLEAGAIDVMCDQTTNTMAEIKGDKIKVYGVTSKNRLSALPNVPTMAEDGVAGLEILVWHALYAPKGTPKAVIDQLSGFIQASLKDPEFKAAMVALNVELVGAESARPEALRAYLKAEIERWTPLIKKAGVYAE